MTEQEREAFERRILADFNAIDENRRAELVDYATALLAEQRGQTA